MARPTPQKGLFQKQNNKPPHTHQHTKIQKFSSTENLSESQQQDLSILLKSERKSIREAFSLARQGGILWRNAIQEAEMLKTSIQEEAEDILDEAQFEKFQSTFGNHPQTGRHKLRRF
ncbi:MAG: hypothetical protein VYA34_08890 [Myxococcota bacterium]|nr:hypothetical protein [Myxococcota bacterium]